ncbi:hypothetical protein TH62_08735 [Bacillus sp. TH008]|nr:hypothetical protein TH62_08735 [Bacillus sp. TH008]
MLNEKLCRRFCCKAFAVISFMKKRNNIQKRRGSRFAFIPRGGSNFWKTLMRRVLSGIGRIEICFLR